MSGDDERYAEASSAALKLPLDGLAGWDPYWFEGDRRLELYFPADLRTPSRLAKFTVFPAVEVLVRFIPRIGAQRLGIAHQGYSLVAGPETQRIRISATAALGMLGVAVVQDLGSAVIRVDSTDEEKPQVRINAASSEQFELSNVSFTLGGTGDLTTRVSAIDSDVSIGRENATLQVGGHCRLLATTDRGLEELLVAPETVVVVDPKGRARSRKIKAMGATEAERNFVVGGEGELAADRIDDCRIGLGGQETSLVVGEARNLRVWGSGSVRIFDNANQIHFDTNGNPNGPVLHMSQAAVLREASGTVQLGAVAHSEIKGTRDRGLEIHSVRQESDGGTTEGLLLRNFTVPVRMTGLQTINALVATAAVADPLIHARLPGQREERSDSGRAKTRESENFRADYAAALSRLAKEKGAAGSTTTKLAWLDYRMREATAGGCVERTVLGLYRGLGYGERPVPAFVLYVVLAAIFTAVTLQYRGESGLDLSARGIANVLTTFGHWLIAPLGGLHLGELNDDVLGSSGPVYVGRILTAIPLVTGSLALRKYVKSGK